MLVVHLEYKCFGFTIFGWCCLRCCFGGLYLCCFTDFNLWFVGLQADLDCGYYVGERLVGLFWDWS